MQLAEAPLLPVDPKVWADTFIGVDQDSSSMTDLITGRTISDAGGRIALAEAFAHLPVAMLHNAARISSRPISYNSIEVLS